MYACFVVAMDLIDVLKEYFSKHGGVRLAVLFGSHARGDQHGASDVDIGISLDHRPDLLELGEIIAALTDLTRKKIDLLELDGLSTRAPLLAYRIAAEGRLLVEAETDAWLEYRNRACLQYFDLEEFLERQRLELVRRLDNGQFARPVHA